MAFRIHATAVRDCPVEDVRATFTEILGAAFQNVPVHQQGGWTWFTTSVWGVNADSLNKGLCRLARPALQFTTSDGSRWYLTLHGGSGGPEAYLHEFHVFSHPADPAGDAEMNVYLVEDEPEPVDPDLAFLEDPPEEPERPRTHFDRLAGDHADFGIKLPEALGQELRGLPYSQVVNRLRDWHASEVPQALARAGIPVDEEAVRKVLLWEGATERERDSDLGNLPRLLSVLGLGGEWDDFLRQAELPAQEETDQAEVEPPAPPPDHARQVLDCVGSLPLHLVEGGAFPVPTGKLAFSGFPSEACSTGASPAMAVLLNLPENLDPPLIKEPGEQCDEVQATRTADGFLFGLLDRNSFCKSDLKAGLGKPLAKFLLEPPDGTVLEADYAVPDEPASYQRYRGKVRDGQWWVEESHPRLTRQALDDAVELAAFESRTKLTCRDAAEAQALEEAARQDNQLHGMGVKRKGTIVSVEFDTGTLATLLLRLRHPGAWDFAPRLAYEAREYQERIATQREMRRSFAEAARRRAAPHDPEVLLKGQNSWYWRSDFLQLDELDQEPREQFDQALQTLGFTHVGDLVAKKQRDFVLRVFRSPDRLCYCLIMGKRTMYLGQEFVSRLSDGSGLTTTTNASLDSYPAAGIYYRTFPGLDVVALYQEHLEGLDRFRKRKKLEPVELEGTLLGVALEIELAFDRQKRVPEES